MFLVIKISLEISYDVTLHVIITFDTCKTYDVTLHVIITFDICKTIIGYGCCTRSLKNKRFETLRQALQVYMYDVINICASLWSVSSLILGNWLNMAKNVCPMSLSGTANWACKVRFRLKTEGRHTRISPYSVNNLFITYSTTEFTFSKPSYCNLKYLNYTRVVRKIQGHSKYWSQDFQ